MPTVADILKDHVVLDVQCFDRLYLNGYIPSLQTERQLTYFLTQHLGNKIASPALPGRMTTDFVRRVEAFIRDQDIPRVEFKKKDRKDTLANDIRSKDPRRDVVVFVGVAQEKQQAFKGRKGRDPKNRHVTFSYSRQTAFVKHYYFCIDDRTFRLEPESRLIPRPFTSKKRIGIVHPDLGFSYPATSIQHRLIETTALAKLDSFVNFLSN